jgi:hypothetical protein
MRALTEQRASFVTRQRWFIAAAMAALVGLAAYGWAEQRESSAIHTSGRVVEILVGRNKDGKTEYHPVVEFRAEPERVVRFQANRSTTRPREGQTMPVSYDPENPTDAWVGGTLWQHYAAYLSFFAAFVLTVIGLAARSGKRSTRPRRPAG